MGQDQKCRGLGGTNSARSKLDLAIWDLYNATYEAYRAYPTEVDAFKAGAVARRAFLSQAKKK